MERNYAVVLEPDESEGGYTVLVPALPGVVTEGESIEEALANAREAIELTIEDLLKNGELVPASDPTAQIARIEVRLPAA